MAAEDKDEIVFGGDAGREFVGSFGGDMVFVFEVFLAAGFLGGEGIEGIFLWIFAGGSIVCINIGVFVGDKSGLLGGGKTWGVGAVKDEDGGIFVDARVVREHLSNVILDVGVVAGAADR